MEPETQRLLQLLVDGKRRSQAYLLRQLGLDLQRLGAAVKELEVEGIALRSLAEGALQLVVRPEPLDRGRIGQLLVKAGVVAAGRAEFFQVLDSTNSYLLQHNSSIHGRCCFAEWQTAGRGRLGRRWQATPYGSVLLSLGWEFRACASTPTGISLAAGVAVIRALEGLGLVGVGLKWPNDLLAKGRKLGGVLVDLQQQGSHDIRCVVGVGLNVNIGAASAASIDQPWIDLAALAGERVDRSELAAQILIELCGVLEELVHSSFESLREEWISHHLYQLRAVTAVVAGERISGTATGVTRDGALLLERNGKQLQVLSGEVTLQGV